MVLGFAGSGLQGLTVRVRRCRGSGLGGEGFGVGVPLY